MTYRPLFASQWLVPLPRGCRISSVYHALALATDGESTMSSIGRTHTQKQRTAALRRGWHAFATQKPADSNGWPDQGDVSIIQDAIASGLPRPRFIDTTDAESIWDRIGKDAVSIATDTGAVPASDALRKYGGAVAHQFVAYKRKTINGTRYVKVIDSRHRRSDVYAGHLVRWSSLRKAAKAVPLKLGGPPGGRIFAERYPVGGWTREASVRRALDKVVDAKNTRIETLADKVGDLRATVAERDLEVAELTIQLTECREDGDPAAARLAALEQAQEAANDAIEALKDVAP